MDRWCRYCRRDFVARSVRMLARISGGGERRRCRYTSGIAAETVAGGKVWVLYYPAGRLGDSIF
eukprot:9470714-Pyramimonas_sp.AAC.2